MSQIRSPSLARCYGKARNSSAGCLKTGPQYRAMISAGKIERGERKQTASEASKSD